MAILLTLTSVVSPPDAFAQASKTNGKIFGMYVHQGWVYRNPYSPRAWTLDNWRGYVDGLQRLGYNTILVWPVLDTMPDPPTDSDNASIERTAAVIEMLHARGMKAYIVLCANIVADDVVAAQARFEDRRFYHCDLRVNPGDRLAVERMMTRRERLLRPLAKVDGVIIIDSDPGGYSKATNDQFVTLLTEHRKVLDRLRPGIELVYWMWAGWQAYGRYYDTQQFKWGEPEEFVDILNRMAQANLEPWGTLCGVVYANKAGMADRACAFPYGVIEGEPAFPLTNFGGDQACNGGRDLAPRGVMGNTQTPCVQLPNTFAFVRGAQGKAVTHADYVQFANDLIIGRGADIVKAWKGLNAQDPAAMRALAEKLEAMEQQPLPTGPLSGLLFGSPKRFVHDLVLQLRYQAAFVALSQAVAASKPWSGSLNEYLIAMETWTAQHGYSGYWVSANDILLKLNAPEINEVLNPRLLASTPAGRIREKMYIDFELFTERLIAAIRTVLVRCPPSATATTKPA
jgi:hypothetical protein